MEAKNRFLLLAGAGGKHACGKSPNARCLETSAEEVEEEKRQEGLRHQQRKVGDNESTQGWNPTAGEGWE